MRQLILSLLPLQRKCQTVKSIVLSNNYFFIICQNNVKTIKIRSGIDDNFAKHSRSNHLATIRAPGEVKKKSFKIVFY